MLGKQENCSFEPDVAAAQRGEIDAFHRLYRVHVGRVNALCQRIIGQRARADDAVQDVFIKAWHQLRDFRGDAKFSTWLHRIAVRTAIDWWRKEQRHQLHCVESQMADGQVVADTQQSEAVATPSDHGLAMDLEAAIATLPAQARAVFVLHAVEGFGHSEIASLLQIAEGTSKAHYHNARGLLRSYLTEGQEQVDEYR